MANFRIKVEALNSKMNVDEELRNELECDGFFLVGHTEQDNNTTEDTVAINMVNNFDMAIAIAKSEDLLEAAIIAQGIDEAARRKRDRKKPKAPDLLAALLNG